METSRTIYVTERLGRTELLRRVELSSPPGGLVIVRPGALTERLLVRDALAHLTALRRHDERFDVAVLACDGRADFASMHTRALIVRALLHLVAPGGRFLLEAPQGFAQRPMLLALLEAIAQLTPRRDVSFGVEFEAAVVGRPIPYVEGGARVTPSTDAN